MNPAFKPMLAVQEDDLTKLVFPRFVTPKIDGIRAVVRGGKLLSRSLKPIPNRFIRSEIERLDLANFDGELLVGDKFHEATSGIMSEDGEPDFRFYVFDNFKYPEDGYLGRMAMLQALPDDPRIIPLFPMQCDDAEALTIYLDQCLAEGFEGAMSRTQFSPYKFGRSTVKEGYLIKHKPFKDDEAKVVGFYEQEHNGNTATVNALGHTERSSHAAGKVGKDTLGGLEVEHPTWGRFRVSTGFTDAQRKEVWTNQDKYLGRMVSFRYQAHGSKDKPRIPTWRGWRDYRDI